MPHRDEYSETVGFLIRGPRRRVAFIPDIDKWERWSRPIEEAVAGCDVAYLDGTFFADGELPGRDMAEIPHPFVVESLRRMLTELGCDMGQGYHFSRPVEAVEAEALLRRQGLILPEICVA